MREKTRKLMEKLVTSLTTKHGGDILDVDNIVRLAMDEVNTLNLDLSIQTVGRYIHRYTSTVKKPVVSALTEPKKTWTGLLDYNDNQIVIIRGAYKGCNIKSKSDIIKYFKTMKRYEQWVGFQLRPTTISRLKSPDTKKDIDTLNKVRETILSTYLHKPSVVIPPVVPPVVKEKEIMKIIFVYTDGTTKENLVF